MKVNINDFQMPGIIFTLLGASEETPADQSSAKQSNSGKFDLFISN